MQLGVSHRAVPARLPPSPEADGSTSVSSSHSGLDIVLSHPRTKTRLGFGVAWRWSQCPWNPLAKQNSGPVVAEEAVSGQAAGA